MASNPPPFAEGATESTDSNLDRYDPPSDSAADEASRALAAIYEVLDDYDPDYRRYLESHPSFAPRARREGEAVPPSSEEGSSPDGERGAERGEDEDKDKGVEGSGGVGPEFDRSVVPNCPICYEMWTSGGAHRVCCIPCGHVYGKSCLLKWLQRCGNYTAKCPQCGKNFKLRDIILLYAPIVVAPIDCHDKESSSLPERNDSHKPEDASLQHNELDTIITGASHSPIPPLAQGEDTVLRETVQRITADHERLWSAIEDLERRTTNLEERLQEQTQILQLNSRLAALENRAADIEQQLAEREETLRAALHQYESEAASMREQHDTELRALRERVQVVEQSLDHYVRSSSRPWSATSEERSSAQGQRRVRRRRG